ncbi:MAG: hypothetical protein JNK85_07675 [Verrucomicrobiales bacterium]|nr:hypothetical protein [Verrucomicrobiales bacterium]
MVAFSLVAQEPPPTSTPVSRPNPAYSIRHTDGGWSFVSPGGDPFFSVGVCVVTQGASPSAFDPENPGYAAWQHHPTTNAWADATLARLKSWKFTTVGGWSDFATLRNSTQQTLALTPVLHLGSTVGAPWWDMWDPAIVARMDDVARAQILPLRDDPRLLGYYTDNELGWWNATLWKMTLEQAPTSGQRRRLLRLLRDTYQENWSRLLADFEPEKADSWVTLEQGGMLYLKSGGGGLKVMRRFLGVLAERYYQLVHDVVRKYDSRALILGDRYQSFYYPEVAQAAAPWVDAISSNLNASWNDGTYVRWHLDTLHQLTGKPIVVSEFYLAARDNRSGNRNNQGVFPVVATQSERATALRRTLDSLARTRYVLGADWFQFFDEPRHGRDDGENFNFGLVDIVDRPYEEVTGAFASFDTNGLRAHPATPRLDASRGVPPAPPDPFADFLPTRALKNWDRERGFVKPSSLLPIADLYVCWTPSAVYLGLYAQDVTEDAFYRDRSVPKSDRAQWLIQVGESQPVRLRLGAGRDPIPSDPSVRLEHISGVNLTVRSITALAMPAERFGKMSFKPGDTIRLRSQFLSHGQSYRVDWDGEFTLRE